MADFGHTLDTTELRQKGFQCIRNLFSDSLKADLLQRAADVIEARNMGVLTADSQDSQGFEYDWFEPLLRHESLVRIATSVLGPNVCGSGWRILAKDRHFQGDVHVHQDWPYNSGDTRKLSIFVPLTRVNQANGGLFFIEESHFYGPVSMGPIDRSRFPPLAEACPDVDVGDIILCDFLTWHYSMKAENDHERIMVQLNYQPASDSSSNNLVAGALPHHKALLSRFDAVSVPSVELNAKQAQMYFDAGDLDRATRYARGLLFDDPDHAGAALLMCKILAQAHDPSALRYLEMARAAVAKHHAEVTAFDLSLGLSPASLPAAAPSSSPVDSRWKPLTVAWSSAVPEFADLVGPGTLGTPDIAWNYGAVSAPVTTDKPVTIRIKARALKGKVGLCLLTEDCSSLASEPYVLTPEEGDSTVMIEFAADNSPARILVRNHDDAGQKGELVIASLDVFEYAR